MSLLSSTVNDDDEELVDGDKENTPGFRPASTAASIKTGSGSGSRGRGGSHQAHRHHPNVFSPASDDALHQRGYGQQQPARGAGYLPSPRPTGYHISPGGVHAASPDRILLPLGTSPVLNVRNGAFNAGNGPANSGNGAFKDSRLRDVEPLLAASPNILGGSGGKSGPRIIHPKANAHPMGTVYCIAYTPPNRTQSSGSGTPNSDLGSGGPKRGELFRSHAHSHAHAQPPTIDEEGELLSTGTEGRRVNSAQKHFHGVDSSIVERSAPSFMSPVAGKSSHRLTPSTPRTNPFDIYDPSELTMSIVSPSVFGISKEKSKINGSTAERSASENVEENDTSSKPFRWSIDQLAILYPADIDITDKEVSKQEIYRTPDVEYEKKVEAAIDEYFSQNYIVPSPWVGQSGAKQQSRLNDLMDCNGSPILDASTRKAETAGKVGLGGPNGSTDSASANVGSGTVAAACRMTKSANTSTAQPAVREVSCQTKLTIPLDVDLEKLLGAYMSATEEVVVVNSNDSSFTSRNNSMMDGGNCVGNDILSTSTLRRKLFSQMSEDEEEPGQLNGSKVNTDGEGSNKIRIKPLPGASDSPKAFNPLDVTPPPIHASSEQVTPADLQYVASSPIRGSGHSPIPRKKGASPRLCMFPKGSLDQSDLSTGLDASSVHVMDLGSAQKPPNPVSSDVKRPNLASLGSPPCSPIGRTTSLQPSVRTSSSPPCSPIGHPPSTRPAVAALRASSSPPCSPIGPPSSSHPAVAAIHASSSPLVRHQPRSQSPSSSTSSSSKAIPFALATPPHQLRPGLSPFLIGAGRGGGGGGSEGGGSGIEEEDSTSKDKFPSPDISPIKDGESDLVKGDAEGDENRVEDPNESEKDILDDDPTPRSLAIHSMTRGDDDDDDDEGDGDDDDDGDDVGDLSGNDPDASQFMASGMEVDTPVKFGLGNTSRRQLMVAQEQHSLRQNLPQTQELFQQQSLLLEQQQSLLLEQQQQQQQQQQQSNQKFRRQQQQHETPHQHHLPPHPASSSTRFSFDADDDSSLLDASRVVDAFCDRSTDYEPSMMEISNSEYPLTAPGAASAGIASVSATSVGAVTAGDAVVGSVSTAASMTKLVDQIVAAPMSLSGISSTAPAFSSSNVAEASSASSSACLGGAAAASSPRQTSFATKYTLPSTSITSFINCPQSRLTSGNSMELNVSNAMGFKWSEPLCLSTPLPPNLLPLAGPTYGLKKPVGVGPFEDLSHIAAKRESGFDMSNNNSNNNNASNDDVVVVKRVEDAASRIFTNTSHRRDEAFLDSLQCRTKRGAAKLLFYSNETGLSDNNVSFAGIIDRLPTTKDIVDEKGVKDDGNVCEDDDVNGNFNVEDGNDVNNRSNVGEDNSIGGFDSLPPPKAESTAVSASTEADNAVADATDNGGEGIRMALNATAPQHQLSWVAPLVASTPTRRKFVETDNDD